MTRLQSITVLAFAAVITAAGAQAQAKDPIIGTWVLNVAKSTFSPGPAPKSQTRIYAPAGDMVVATFSGVNGDGTAMKINFTAGYDEKDHPYTGDPNVDAIAFKRVDPYTVEATLKKGGKVVGHATRVISKGDKTFTLTQTGINAMGKNVKNVMLFERK